MTRCAPARPPTLSHASLEQAAHWYVQLNDQQVDEQARLRWQAWLAQSGEHQTAWNYVERVGQRFAALQEDQPHAASQVLRNTRRTPLSRRQTIKSLLILGSGGVMGWGAWRQTSLPDVLARWTADLATGTGETRETLLSDGSRVWLNALSALNVRFDDRQRLLLLRCGEMYIDTGKDQRRPLLVHTTEGRLRALGTRFSVRQEAQRTVLNVYQGAVEVRPHLGSIQVVEAGRQLVFTQHLIPPTTPAVASAEAWRRGLLLADNMPLGELIEALSRYRHGHLACDPAIAALPVMGSFALHDSEQTLQLLEAALPIRVERILPWWVSISPRA